MPTTKVTIYWAGPLFTQAERIWNRMCVENLRERGYDVILPQEEASQFIDRYGNVDFDGLAKDCLAGIRRANVTVGILDGADSDSGTSLELGYALAAAQERNRNNPSCKVKVIGIRTDFRGSEDNGVNAMFRALDRVIVFPSFNESYEELCHQIHVAIRDLRGETL